MPQRHLIIIFLAALISLACYQVASRNRLAGLITQASDLMVNQGLYEVEQDQLLVSAMDGMLKNLDPYSAFLYGTDADVRDEYMNQVYAGLGIHIRRDSVSKNILVVKPVYGSPASEVGMKTGDLIQAIGDHEVSKIESMDEIRGLLRGPEGSEVNLSVSRTDQDGTTEIKQFAVPRRSIPTPSVVGDLPDEKGGWYFYLEDEPKVGYIRVKQFGTKTTQELKVALEAIDGQVDSLILDLRENPGGLLESAVEISDFFLSESGQTIVSIKNRAGNVQQEYVSTQGKILKTPVKIVVLVNQNSASASEILAACLQDHKVATVVGEKSFGKGTVQTQFVLSRPRTFLNLTTASYWRPSGKNIHRMRWRSKESMARDLKGQAVSGEEDWGVKPDVGCSVRLTNRDATMLSLMRDNRQLGIGADDVEDSIKTAIDRIGRTTGNLPVANDGANPLMGNSDVSQDDANAKAVDAVVDQVFWDNPGPFQQRDPQIRRAIELLMPANQGSEQSQPTVPQKIAA